MKFTILYVYKPEHIAVADSDYFVTFFKAIIIPVAIMSKCIQIKTLYWLSIILQLLCFLICTRKKIWPYLIIKPRVLFPQYVTKAINCCNVCFSRIDNILYMARLANKYMLIYQCNFGLVGDYSKWPHARRIASSKCE